MFLSVLKEESGNTFNDSKRRLFQAMVNIVNNTNETTDKKKSMLFLELIDLNMYGKV